MSLQQDIDRIIAQRQPMAEKIKITRTNIQSIQGSLSLLKESLSSLKQSSGDSSNFNFNEIDSKIANLEQKLEAELAPLTVLFNRFSRQTLNVGVVGNAGQGKSYLLQNISTLGEDVIPTSKGGHCTGASYSIYNDPVGVDRNGGNVFAEVNYYSEDAFMKKVIKPFCDELSISPVPQSIVEFQSNKLELSDNQKTTLKEKHNKLTQYKNSIGHIKHLFGKGKVVIQVGEIRKHIAQNDEHGKDYISQNCPNYLAVEHAIIHCKFSRNEVGKIMLQDTPGVGDFLSGLESRITETIRDFYDFVFYVQICEKTARFGTEHTRVYDAIRSSVPSLSTDQWTYCLLNYRDNEGLNVAQTLKTTISNSSCKFTEIIIANFKNKQEVDSILVKLADYLVSNIEELDKKFVSQQNERLKNIEKELKEFEQYLSEKNNKCPSPKHDQRLLLTKFNETYTNLVNEIKQYLSIIKKDLGKEDAEFSSKVTELNVELDTNKNQYLLSNDRIRNDINSGGMHTAYEHAMNHARTELSKKYLDLSESIIKKLKEQKGRIKEIFSKHGLLERINELKTEDEVLFFKELSKLLNQTGCIELAKAINVFGEFSLNYRGFIQHKVRSKLTELDTGYANVNSSDIQNETYIYDLVSGRYDGCLYQVNNSLVSDVSIEFNYAIFAILEELVDSIVHGQEARDNWQVLYASLKNEIWSREFNEFDRDSRLWKNFNIHVTDLVSTSQQPITIQ